MPGHSACYTHAKYSNENDYNVKDDYRGRQPIQYSHVVLVVVILKHNKLITVMKSESVCISAVYGDTQRFLHRAVRLTGYMHTWLLKGMEDVTVIGLLHVSLETHSVLLRVD